MCFLSISPVPLDRAVDVTLLRASVRHLELPQHEDDSDDQRWFPRQHFGPRRKCVVLTLSLPMVLAVHSGLPMLFFFWPCVNPSCLCSSCLCSSTC